MATYVDQLDEVAPRLLLKTPGGLDLDISGFENIDVRLQLGAADEFTLTMPAQNLDLEWRSDMPAWQVGSYVGLWIGYGEKLDLLQMFETVSTTTNYSDDGENLIVRGVSDLARAARNRIARTFGAHDDMAIIDELCAFYGWKNKVEGTLLSPKDRLKEQGTSDLELLKTIAKEAKLGGPRVTNKNELVMPEPKIGKLKYCRGTPPSGSGWRRLHSIGMNRDGGPNPTTVAVISFDNAKKEFVQIEFQADEFGGDPKVVFEGKASIKELTKESTTQGLTLAVIDHQGHDKKERIDVLASGRFMDETNATDLAKRWFELREKLSRWSDLEMDGTIDMVPYESIEIDGNLAAMDKGVWLPITVTHKIGSGGWFCSARSVRVVEEAVVKPT